MLNRDMTFYGLKLDAVIEMVETYVAMLLDHAANLECVQFSIHVLMNLNTNVDFESKIICS